MTTPKRYEPDLQYGGYGDAPAPMMSEYPDGDYVHYDDYRQLAAKLAEAEAERDRYKDAVQQMVDKAAANKLDGYRELGKKAARAEAERDEARQQLAEAKADMKNVSATSILWKQERDEARQQLAEAEAERDRLQKKNYELAVMGVELAFQRDEARQQLAETKADRDNWNNSLAKQTARVAVLESQLTELREAATVVSRTLRHWVERSGSADYAALADKLSIALAPAQPEPETLSAGMKHLQDAAIEEHRAGLTEPWPDDDPAQPEPEITEQDKTWEQFCDEVKEDLGLEKVFGPDPGEGWELCNSLEAEQWRDANTDWITRYDEDTFEGYGGWFRRRKVMTEPPSREAVPDDLHAWCSYRDIPDLSTTSWSGAVIRGRMKYGIGVAWCHRLDGETEPPKILANREGE